MVARNFKKESPLLCVAGLQCSNCNWWAEKNIKSFKGECHRYPKLTILGISIKPKTEYSYVCAEHSSLSPINYN